MLVLKDICKRYTQKDGPQIEILRDTTFSLSAGDFVSIQGASGCGKSTLLMVCAGLLSPDSGQVFLADTDVYAQSPNGRAQLRARHMGFVFQQFHLIPYLSLRDNILSAGLAGTHKQVNTRAARLMDRFGLKDRAHHRVSALSIGERQRTALARALVCDPKLILADEPTGNLDPDNSDEVLGALDEFASQGGAVILVTHDPDINRYASRRVHMSEGILHESCEA
ncbi:MAG: ABC transporter ATP-binding protein [Planctomycetes bacterium]|nr:ABC transporter ATP-binding protein [Planctomycetota bacterium]